LETSKGDLPLALGLGIVLLAVVLLLNAMLAGLRLWGERRNARPASEGRTLGAQP
jgi:tungstate transport system permease protein